VVGDGGEVERPAELDDQRLGAARDGLRHASRELVGVVRVVAWFPKMYASNENAVWTCRSPKKGRRNRS
jgi:hypothetical protein